MKAGSMNIYRLCWRDGQVKEVEAHDVIEAIFICGKGMPATYNIILNVPRGTFK